MFIAEEDVGGCGAGCYAGVEVSSVEPALIGGVVGGRGGAFHAVVER